LEQYPSYREGKIRRNCWDESDFGFGVILWSGVSGGFISSTEVQDNRAHYTFQIFFNARENFVNALKASQNHTANHKKKRLSL